MSVSEERRKKMSRDWLTNLFRNEAESFLFSVWKLCEEDVDKSDKLSLRVLAFLEDTDRRCSPVWYNFLSVGTRTLKIDCMGSDNWIPARVATTDRGLLHLNLGMHWNYSYKWIGRFSKLRIRYYSNLA